MTIAASIPHLWVPWNPVNPLRTTRSDDNNDDIHAYAIMHGHLSPPNGKIGSSLSRPLLLRTHVAVGQLRDIVTLCALWRSLPAGLQRIR
jgi:hypothetical protein